jgi:hypothetical protein
MSVNKDPERDMLKLLAYGELANLWINLASKGEMSEEEAKSFIGIQDALIKEYEKILQAYLDFPSMKAFGEYITKYKVRIA